MRNYICILLIVISAISCGKEKTISEELVGDWFYERETFNSFSIFEDPDTEGFMSFSEDETGNWSQANGFQDFSLEWDLQANDTKIAITRYLIDQPTIFPSTLIYDLQREDEDNFTFTFHIKVESPIDSLEEFEQFENIILTRM